MTHEMSLLCETIQEITLAAWPLVYGKDNKYDLDSRVVLEEFRDWGEEFEKWWQDHDGDWIDNHDYLDEVTAFAQIKAHEYVKYLKG